MPKEELLGEKILPKEFFLVSIPVPLIKLKNVLMILMKPLGQLIEEYVKTLEVKLIQSMGNVSFLIFFVDNILKNNV